MDHWDKMWHVMGIFIKFINGKVGIQNFLALCQVPSKSSSALRARKFWTSWDFWNSSQWLGNSKRMTRRPCSKRSHFEDRSVKDGMFWPQRVGIYHDISNVSIMIYVLIFLIDLSLNRSYRENHSSLGYRLREVLASGDRSRPFTVFATFWKALGVEFWVWDAHNISQFKLILLEFDHHGVTIPFVPLNPMILGSHPLYQVHWCTLYHWYQLVSSGHLLIVDHNILQWYMLFLHISTVYHDNMATQPQVRRASTSAEMPPGDVSWWFRRLDPAVVPVTRRFSGRS